jgi:hypothetical protein
MAASRVSSAAEPGPIPASGNASGRSSVAKGAARSAIVLAQRQQRGQRRAVDLARPARAQLAAEHACGDPAAACPFGPDRQARWNVDAVLSAQEFVRGGLAAGACPQRMRLAREDDHRIADVKLDHDTAGASNPRRAV